MTQPMERAETVFPRWVTLSVMVAWVALMVWAVNFSTITLT